MAPEARRRAFAGNTRAGHPDPSRPGGGRGGDRCDHGHARGLESPEPYELVPSPCGWSGVGRSRCCGPPHPSCGVESGCHGPVPLRRGRPLRSAATGGSSRPRGLGPSRGRVPRDQARLDLRGRRSRSRRADAAAQAGLEPRPRARHGLPRRSDPSGPSLPRRAAGRAGGGARNLRDHPGSGRLPCAAVVHLPRILCRRIAIPDDAAARAAISKRSCGRRASPPARSCATERSTFTGIGRCLRPSSASSSHPATGPT